MRTPYIVKALWAGIIVVWAVGQSFASEDKICPTSFSLLMNSCKTPAVVSLRVLPDDIDTNKDHILSVTGAYSSGDRFGIEGLAIHKGKVVSRRYHGWDGLLIIDEVGKPRLFNSKNVTIDGKRYNLKSRFGREKFIKQAVAQEWSVLQSHLLISDGELDLRDVENAPRFKRRLLVSFDNGEFAVWESKQSETLYDAALKIKDEVAPSMALNLDMGAYDYCKRGDADNLHECGGLLVSSDKLTNILVFTKKNEDKAH